MIKVTYENGVEIIQVCQIRGTFAEVHTAVVDGFMCGTWPEGAIQATVEGQGANEFRVIG